MTGRKENSEALTKIIDTGDHLKVYVTIKVLEANFQEAWSGYLGKAAPLDVYFNSGKSFSVDVQFQSVSSAICRCVL